MGWYRIVITVIGAVGLLVAIANWYFNGVDVPNGLVTLLSLILSVTLGPDAVNTLKGGTKSSPPDATKEVVEEVKKEIETDVGS